MTMTTRTEFSIVLPNRPGTLGDVAHVSDSRKAIKALR
jgi:hypothetical protein